MSRSYKELQIGRPKRPFLGYQWEVGALYKLCKTLTPEQRSVVPDLEEEFQWNEWWQGLSLEERKTITNVEWKYD